MRLKLYKLNSSNMEQIKRHTHELDAAGKAAGRLATQISRWLQGKHKPSYVPHIDMGDSVHVTHIDELHFTGKKLANRMYYRHSGHLGNLKIIPMKRVFEVDPAEVLRKAVKQMLPKNRLLPGRMKRLMIDKV